MRVIGTLLVTVLLILPVIGLTLQPSISGNIQFKIKGYDDGVLVDFYANLSSIINKTIENNSSFKLVVDAKTYMPSKNMLRTNGTVNLTVTADTLRNNKVNAYLKLTYKSMKGYADLFLKAVGNYTNVNGTLDFIVKLKSSGNINNTTTDLSANITIPIDMIGKDVTKQLVMMSAFLTERTVNLYLEQLNMTFIKFKTLQITTNINKQENKVYINVKAVFYVNGTEALVYQEKHGTTPMMGTNMTGKPQSIPPIQTPFYPSKETNTSAELEATMRTIGNQLTLNTVFHGEIAGDLEKAAEEIHREFVKAVREVNGTLPPGLDEVYLVPSPGKFKLVINTTAPNKVNIGVVAEGIRFKHVNLTGIEAQKRTAAIILGYIVAIQSYIPPTVNMNIKITNIEETGPDAKIKEEATSYLGSFMRGLPLPLSTQTTTTTPTMTPTSSSSASSPLTITSSTVSSSATTTTVSSPTSSPTPTESTSPPPTTTTTTTKTTTQTTTSLTIIHTVETQSTTTQSATSATVTVSQSVGEGETWVWVATATIVIITVAAGLLYVVLKKR